MPEPERFTDNRLLIGLFLISTICLVLLFIKPGIPGFCLSCNAQGVQPAEGLMLVFLGGGATLAAARDLPPPLSGKRTAGKASEGAGILSVIWSAAYGAIQNFLPVTPPTVAGPGIIDDALYLNKIRSAKSPEEANRVAATEIWDMLLPGLGDKMKPATESLLDLGKKR